MPTDFGIEDESKEKEGAIATLNTMLKEPTPDPRVKDEETLKQTIQRLLNESLDMIKERNLGEARNKIKKALKASEEIR